PARSRAPGCWSAACRRRSIMAVSAVDMRPEIAKPLVGEARQGIRNRVDRLAQRAEVLRDPAVPRAVRMDRARQDHLLQPWAALDLADDLACPDQLRREVRFPPHVVVELPAARDDPRE